MGHRTDNWRITMKFLIVVAFLCSVAIAEDAKAVEVADVEGHEQYNGGYRGGYGGYRGGYGGRRYGRSVTDEAAEVKDAAVEAADAEGQEQYYGGYRGDTEDTAVDTEDTVVDTEDTVEDTEDTAVDTEDTEVDFMVSFPGTSKLINLNLKNGFCYMSTLCYPIYH